MSAELHTDDESVRPPGAREPVLGNEPSDRGRPNLSGDLSTVFRAAPVPPFRGGLQPHSSEGGEFLRSSRRVGAVRAEAADEAETMRAEARADRTAASAQAQRTVEHAEQVQPPRPGTPPSRRSGRPAEAGARLEKLGQIEQLAAEHAERIRQQALAEESAVRLRAVPHRPPAGPPVRGADPRAPQVAPGAPAIRPLKGLLAGLPDPGGRSRHQAHGWRRSHAVGRWSPRHRPIRPG